MAVQDGADESAGVGGEGVGLALLLFFDCSKAVFGKMWNLNNKYPCLLIYLRHSAAASPAHILQTLNIYPLKPSECGQALPV